MLDFLEISFADFVDISVVAILLYYLYKLIKGTGAINIFIGIVVIYIIWKLTDALNMQLVSGILGSFISVGFFALIVVFRAEIRKFLLLIGSTRFNKNYSNIKLFFNIIKNDTTNIKIDIDSVISACKDLASTNTGAIIVIERQNSLDYLKHSGLSTEIKINKAIIESIFFKNSPLHDGAILIRDNQIIATKVVLPVSDSKELPARFGLRHRAGMGISEKTDALVLIVSEETGKISYFKNGNFFYFETLHLLNEEISKDLSL